MTSSMLAGERRWASARRGGMTVLGKVPKPLNLPSQRLENHGLDPNVEIVPKGSLSWGSRSSSSASNPWGSSALSPNTDGATGSPSHRSGRPSSGGSLTRPSTAGSDRNHEPSTAWGPNSRPSSASGALTSNQTSLTSSRPRSAETRPGSSQLSRFAEPVFENSVAWGPNGTVEKLVLGSKNDDFSLSSGDFPTLGSEKDNAGKNSESQDQCSHLHPTSASGRVAPSKERTPTSQADVKSGTVNTWTRDRGGPQHVEDGVHPSVEKWQGDPPQYLNHNVPPQHFDAWRGPPMNAPAGVWYRGPSGGPPYPPVAHVGYPMEPFPYYRPQMPPPAMANSQPVPPPGAGPRGHHPKSGDFYRPQMPDAFIRPGMPIRPGFYPGPVPYDGYYGPPMGYPNERDIPFMGLPAATPVYNMYSAQNPSEPGDNHARAGGRGSTGKVLVSEQVDSGRSEEARGPYKVLMKQHNEWDAEEENWESTTASNSVSLEKGDQPRTTLRKNEWGADNKRNEETHSRRKTIVENSSSRSLGNRGHSSDSVILKSPEGMGGKPKTVDDSWGKRSEVPASSLPEMPQVFPAKPKDSTLIQKIEGLNAKVRASDGREDAASSSIREEQKNRLLVINPKVKNSTKEVASTHTTGDLVPPSHESGVSTGDTTLQSTADSVPPFARRAHHGMQGRVDHHSKGKLSNQNQDADGWRRKPPSLVSESSAAVSTDHNSLEAAEKSEAKNGGESLTSMFDPTDGQAQRAKMRELAKQRAIQLQKEEEERIREQKARALAKLEELNRRTLAADGLAQKVEKALPTVATQQDQEESQALPEPVISASKHEEPSSVLDSSPQAVAQTSESCASGARESSIFSSDKNARQEPVVQHGQATLKLDIHNAGADDSKAALLVNDVSLPRQKRPGHKQKQSTQVEKSLSDKPAPVSTTSEALKDHTGAASEVVAKSEESSLLNNPNILPESLGHQRRKNNNSSKNKHKPDDASTMPTSTSSPSLVPRETYPAKASIESAKPKTSQLVLDSSSMVVADLKDENQPNLVQNYSLPSEEGHGRVNSQWKPQHSRKMPRNPQANRPDRFHGSDAVMWAPVRSQNKAEPGNEASQRSVEDAVPVSPPAKGNNLVQTILKSRRAEMERYVPKPVAKELAQQGSIQQPVSGKTTFDETSEREESGAQPAIPASGNVGSTAESKNGDGKQNKQAKTHGGALRQRRQGFQQGSSLTSNSSKNIQKSMDRHEPSKADTNFVQSENNFLEHEWDPSDGWNIPEYPPTAVAPVTSVEKDQKGVVTGKGNRHRHKGQRSTVNNYGDIDHKNVSSGGETDKKFTQPTALEISQAERPISSKESRASHWQPKSQAYSANNNNQRGIQFSGGQNVNSEVNKDSINVTPKLQPEESASGNKNVREAPPNAGHQEARRERRLPSSRGRAHSPNLCLGNTEDEAPLEQNISSGHHKNGSHNNRSGRGNEFRGNWNGGGQDNNRQQQHNIPPNRGRQRQNQNPHYEYQPVGSNNNNNKFNNSDAPTDGSCSLAPRYRERSLGQSRRGGGNFYGRQSGSIRVEVSYD